ncbi:MAG: Gfo/Idh/MocA family oxidoreductase [Bacteroidales bacterium]
MTDQGQNVAIIGVGNLGRAVTTYFKGKRSKLNVVALFDNDPQKAGRTIAGLKCFLMEDMEKVMKENTITIPSRFSLCHQVQPGLWQMECCQVWHQGNTEFYNGIA